MLEPIQLGIQLPKKGHWRLCWLFWWRCHAETSAKFKAAIPSIVAYVEKSIAQAANTPGAAAVQPVSDADFAAYREKQNKIFATSGDLSALLSNLKF